MAFYDSSKTLKYWAIGLAMVVAVACSSGSKAPNQSGRDGGSDGGAVSITAHKVFVTSTTGTGNLSSWPEASGHTGLAAGDAICRARANAAGLQGTFVAWLSDTQNDAYCRVHGLTGRVVDKCGQATLPATAGPWVRTDGLPWSNRFDQLPNQAQIALTFTPLLLDEFGMRASSEFFTSSKADGVYSNGSNSVFACNGWVSAASSDTSELGTGEWSSYKWSWASRETNCDTPMSIVCFEAGAGTAFAFPANAGKKVFITSTTGTGALASWAGAQGQSGVAAGDAVCSVRASAAGLANAASFKAFLTQTGSNALSRLTSNGPWVRIDGIKVADSKTSLARGPLLAFINQTELGQYQVAAPNVWTGTDGSVLAAANCSNWSMGSTSSGALGWADSVFRWSGRTATDTGITCSTVLHLYCFED